MFERFLFPPHSLCLSVLMLVSSSCYSPETLCRCALSPLYSYTCSFSYSAHTPTPLLLTPTPLPVTPTPLPLAPPTLYLCPHTSLYICALILLYMWPGAFVLLFFPFCFQGNDRILIVRRGSLAPRQTLAAEEAEEDDSSPSSHLLYFLYFLY